MSQEIFKEIYDKRCGTCKFFVYPFCKRHAPTVIVKLAFCEETTWPEVSHFDWCGDYEFDVEKFKERKI